MYGVSNGRVECNGGEQADRRPLGRCTSQCAARGEDNADDEYQRLPLCLHQECRPHPAGGDCVGGADYSAVLAELALYADTFHQYRSVADRYVCLYGGGRFLHQPDYAVCLGAGDRYCGGRLCGGGRGGAQPL